MNVNNPSIPKVNTFLLPPCFFGYGFRGGISSARLKQRKFSVSVRECPKISLPDYFPALQLFHHTKTCVYWRYKIKIWLLSNKQKLNAIPVEGGYLKVNNKCTRLIR